MPLTTIATPRKCIDLEAGVCSGAALLGAGFVGVLTAGPARLALVPLAGGDGKIADLSLTQVQELALLSSDVAVVRDGDHALWAVTDPFGAARAKQIARDVRALSARPWGESAVALHLDGSATALTLSRQEVGARHLTVRGALRACDVGESVTYVVLDGEGGGQLRIHPGATPELGTSARTALPREAALLDRLRGGPLLSALFKRGAPDLCVITGSPNKLAAKLVQLDGKPADVAVLEDCLLVAFVDGRIALYDAGSLDRAGDAPLTATSVVTPTTRGKPRVVLATAKGSPALWIGTTAGEVLCAPLGREAAAAQAGPPPEVPRLVEIRPSEAPPPLVSVATLAAELAATREALTDTAAAREAAEERAGTLAAAAEEMQRAQAVAADEQIAAHRRAVDEQDAVYAGALEAQAAEHARALEALRAAGAAALEQATRAAREAVDARDCQLEEAGAQLEAARVRFGDAEVARAALGSELDAATAERDTARVELAAARAGALAAEERGRALAAELAARTRERDAQSAEVARLERGLAAEREKTEKDSLKWGDRRISLEGARETVDSVLTQARRVFKRPRD